MDSLKKLCRERLIASGFSEALKFEGNFYKPDTQYTAYFVNFKNRGDRIGICYGVASTAFTRMAGCENSLVDYGILNEDACIRYFIYLEQPEDISETEMAIRKHLLLHKGISKEDLLLHIKERRKVFLNTIHRVLKPEGFKRKGSEWTYHLSPDHVLQFVADKSSFCDSYRFLIMIRSEKKLFPTYSWCNMYEMQPSREDAYDPNSAFRFDWQLNSDAELKGILHDFVDEYVLPAKKMGLDQLGRMEYIKNRCNCNKKCCESCWIDAMPSK